MDGDLVGRSVMDRELGAWPKLRNLFQFEIGKQQIWMKNFHSYLHYNGQCLMGKCTMSLTYMDEHEHAGKLLCERKGFDNKQ